MSGTNPAPDDPFGFQSPLGDPYGGLLPYARDRRTGKVVWADQAVGPHYDMSTVDTFKNPPAPVGPISARLGNALRPAPDTTYGEVLPFAIDNKTGERRLAMPNMLRSMLQGGVDLLEGPATGEVSDAAAGTLAMLTGRNLLAGAGQSEASLTALGARSRKPKAPANALEAPGAPATALDDPISLAGVAMSPRALRRVRELADSGAPGEADRISTRVPTSVPMGGKENSIAYTNPDYVVGHDSSRASGDAYNKNAQTIRGYDGIRLPEAGASAEEVSQHFIKHLKDNILALHDAVPEDIRPRSQLWYDGAFRIAHDWAEEYGMTPRAIAGAIAALSPQMDWFKNVSLARRVLDIDQRQGNMSMTPEMRDYANSFIESVRRDKGTKARPKDPEKQAIAADGLQQHLVDMQGRPLSQIKDLDQRAMWTRYYDEAHNSRDYHILTPEGDQAGLSLTGKGVPEKIGWSGFGEIAKAISAIKDPSLENISRSMGQMHKVRNFYNNIISPNSLHGDVTIDTHAIAGALSRPLSGKHAEVQHGLGTSGAANSAPTGSKGLYGLYAEAYRQAAAERNILPRQMQSITWEAQRGLFSAGSKRNLNFTDLVRDVWNDYQRGHINGDEARAWVNAIAGGIDKPDWHAPAP